MQTMTINFALALLLLHGGGQANAQPAELSHYRQFEFGTSVNTILEQTGLSAYDTKVLHQRPALIEELQWRPPSNATLGRPDAVLQVVFRFLDGKLYQVTAAYDRYQIEGLRAADLRAAISETFGMSGQAPPGGSGEPGAYEDEEVLIASWEDARYSFALIRFSFGRTYKLVGFRKDLQALARAAATEAARLDVLEAPARELADLAKSNDLEKERLEKVRALNKSKFRP